MSVKESREGVGETELGERLGLSRVRMRTQRKKLQQGADWWKVGKVIMWSEDAAKNLLDSYRAPTASEPESGAAGPEELDNEFDAKVVRFPKNSWFAEVAVNGVCKPVRMFKRGGGRKMMKKLIRVRRDENGQLYQAR